MVSITRTEPEEYYDIGVPDAHHYLAEGVFHHNSTKSTDAARFALEYWLEMPNETVVIMCSTSTKMLKMRVWSEVIRLYNALPQKINIMDENGRIVEQMSMGPIGRLISTETKIMWAPGDDKHGLTGVAVEEGPVEQVVSNHLGVHAKRVLLIMDEMQAIRPAILKAASSNMAKNEEFKLLGLGNPDSFDSLLSRESEPVNGWSSIDIEKDHTWKTLGNKASQGGICVFTDGRKSPADDSEEERKRLHFLINKDWIADHLYRLRGNADDPDYWTQSIGFPPSAGTRNTVLDQSIIETFNCKGKAMWTKTPTLGAGLDPAFSFGGGDKKVLQFFKFGETLVQEDEGLKSRWMIEFTETAYVPVSSSSKDPLDYQIARFVIEQCKLKGVLPENLGTDSTAIGRGVRAILDMEFGSVIGVEFGGMASDRAVNNVSDKTCREQYDNRSAELNISIREFAMSGSIRGLPTEAASQLCVRRTTYENKKQKVETKADLKKRINRSPDEADAVAICVEVAKQRGAIASISKAASKPTINQERAVRESDEYFESSYLEDEYATT